MIRWTGGSRCRCRHELTKATALPENRASTWSNHLQNKLSRVSDPATLCARPIYGIGPGDRKPEAAPPPHASHWRPCLTCLDGPMHLRWVMCLTRVTYLTTCLTCPDGPTHLRWVMCLTCAPGASRPGARTARTASPAPTTFVGTGSTRTASHGSGPRTSRDHRSNIGP